MFKFETKLDKTIRRKIKQFSKRDIIIEYDDLKKYLIDFYFVNINEKNKKNLSKFLKDNNINEIVDYLMSDAIVNPKY